VASAAKTRSPVLMSEIDVAPTDSTLTVSDPAKQDSFFDSVDDAVAADKVYVVELKQTPEVKALLL
jgi:hypothetical protein